MGSFGGDELLPKLELLASWLHGGVAASLFAVAFACQGGLNPLLLARFQIESVAFNFLDDVFLQNFTLEAP